MAAFRGSEGVSLLTGCCIMRVHVPFAGAEWLWKRRPAGGRALLALLAVAQVSCADQPSAPAPSSDLVARFGLRPLPAMVHPADNAPDSARIELGRLLFFDPIQSGGKDVACATCHLPRFAFTDGRELPAGPSGIGFGPDRVLTDPTMVDEARNSPTIINVGFYRFGAQETAAGFLFWDGRRRGLENLVLLPQLEFTEMRADHYPVEHALDSVLTRLRGIEEYEGLFARAFPDNAARMAAGAATSVIDSLSLARALAQFIRSVVSNRSRYDRFVAGEAEALTSREQHGLVLFFEKGGCAGCHSGPLFSDFNFHIVGARQQGPGFQETPLEDFGRWAVTRLEADRYRFRTPSLRNVALTAPYTHAGAYETLGDVVRLMASGGGDHPGVPGDRIELRPRGLSDAEIDAIVSFLETLTDLPDVQVPIRVPSGLEVPR
jgi:cytochrome c peroxidase